MRFALPTALALSLLACSSDKQQGPQTSNDAPMKKGAPVETGPVTTKILSFAIDGENLKVDKISMRDGNFNPDGNRDLVFTAMVEGPIDAFYLVTCDEKGTPHYGFRADTIVGHEEIPHELGSVVDVGRLTVWIAVVENNRWNNSDRGTLSTLSAGQHSLRLYVPNPGNLLPNSHLRLYARTPGGTLVPGPVIPY